MSGARVLCVLGGLTIMTLPGAEYLAEWALGLFILGVTLWDRTWHLPGVNVKHYAAARRVRRDARRVGYCGEQLPDGQLCLLRYPHAGACSPFPREDVR